MALDAYEVRFRSIAELAEAFTTDLVRHRLFVRGAHHTRPGDDVSVRLVLPETQSVLTLTGLVFEHVKDDARGVGAIVVLLDLLDETVSLIEQFITERLDASQPEHDAPSVDKPLDVLVVDDDATFREHAASAFRRGGDRVRFASDGFEALAAAIRQKPDVILSDVNMPRMDGWQLLRMIRSNAKLQHVPVVFTTQLAGERERLRGYQLGVDDFVAKPFRPSELRARAERLIHRAQTERPAPKSRAGIRGDLSQVSLASVLSLLELEQRCGSVVVNGAISGVLWIADGRVVNADVSKPADEQSRTAFEGALMLLGATDGEFVFSAGEVPVRDELDVSITALILEHARMVDELTRRKTS